MTDYLELLLVRRQEEETEEAFAWRWAKERHYAAAMEKDERKWNADEREPIWNEGDPATDVAGRLATLNQAVARAQSDRHWGAEGQGADLAGQMTALARAVVRGKGEPVARERGTMASARAVEQHRMEWTHATTSGMQRGLAGALDAAFERDARRYDGPLGLF